MMIDTQITIREAEKLYASPLLNGVPNDQHSELAKLVNLANAKLVSEGKKVRIILRPMSEKPFKYVTGFLWWRKTREVTLFELIHWYAFPGKPPMFKSYNWPAMTVEEAKDSFRPYATPSQIKTYLEAITNI